MYRCFDKSHRYEHNFDLCKESGLPKPEFELANGYVYLTIRFKHSLTPYLSDGVNSEADMLGESLKQVYNLIQGNPGIKANQLAEKLGRSINTRVPRLRKDRRLLRHINCKAQSDHHMEERSTAAVEIRADYVAKNDAGWLDVQLVN